MRGINTNVLFPQAVREEMTGGLWKAAEVLHVLWIPGVLFFAFLADLLYNGSR